MVKETEINKKTHLNSLYGSFIDSVNNAVYGLQKYINMLQSNIDITYINCDSKIPDKNIQNLVNFFILESENIIIGKSIMFANEIERMAIQKYESLIKNITENDKNYTYTFSFDAYMYLKEYLDTCETQMKNINPYNKKPSIVKQIYQFLEYLSLEMDIYKKSEFKLSETPMNMTDITTILNDIFTKLSVTFLLLKRLLEDSNSAYNCAIICRKIITIMIIVYYVLISIQIYE